MEFRPAHGTGVSGGRTSGNAAIYTQKGNDRMTAFIGEFIFEAIRLIVMVGVCLAAIFCGKKLRDRKDAKNASESADGKQ